MKIARLLLLAVAVPILAITSAHAQAATYTIQLAKCDIWTNSTYPSMTCGPALVTDSMGAVVEEQIALLFNRDGSITLLAYTPGGTETAVYSVDPNTGNFSDSNGVVTGNIAYTFIVSRHRGYKGSWTTTTYITGTITG
jgi:hypothetical protein